MTFLSKTMWINGTKLDLEGRNLRMTHIWLLKFEYKEGWLQFTPISCSSCHGVTMTTWNGNKMQQQKESKVVSLGDIWADASVQSERKKEIQQ